VAPSNKMETGDDFEFRDQSHLIVALGTRHRTEASPFKRSCSREQDREIDGLIDVLAKRAPSAALQTIGSAAGSEIGPTWRVGGAEPNRCVRFLRIAEGPGAVTVGRKCCGTIETPERAICAILCHEVKRHPSASGNVTSLSCSPARLVLW
jgi:hypothetical protein